MFRRFLQRLEQGIEGLGREHVHFIDNVDLVARPAGARAHGQTHLADLVDAAVAGRIHLDNVHILARGDALADLALVARGGRRASNAVEGASEDARGRGFADATRSGEQVSVSDTAGLDGVAERASDGFLADEVGEGVRAIASGKR